MNRKQLLKTELKLIKEKIVNHYQPEKIILFGSVVNGKINENSDLDLMIIKETSLPFLERLKEVAFIARPKVATDFLVYTPSEYQTMLSQNHYFTQEIEKGEIIYEK